jgi:hypothetical protein
MLSMPIRLLLVGALLGGAGLAWAFWYENWRARNGIRRRTSDGDSSGGDTGGDGLFSWIFGDGGGDGGDGGGGDGGGGGD